MNGDYEDIRAGVREGRLGAETARLMMEQRQRDIRAHSNEHAANLAHQAIDRAFGRPDPASEFAHLFPPHSPYIEGDEDEEGTGHYMPRRTQRVYDNQRRASAPVTDAEVFRTMYGYDAPESYFDE